jgi:SAM-dependent methyltransferase
MPCMTDTITTPAGARETYERFAAFYDAFTAHHRYDEWMPSLEAIALANGLEGTRLLDVGCGTGKSFLPMLARGYEVTGCDVSPAMLAEARRKVGGRVPLFEADMRDLPPLGPFDLVTCIDEPLNYLLDEDDLARALRSAARCLRPGGIYLFDLNTLHAYRTAFAADEEYEQEGWTFRWEGRGDPEAAPGSICEMRVEGREPLPGGGFAVHECVHRQRHHPRALVELLLAEAGLELRAVWGQFQSGDQDPVADELVHTKAIYVARRVGARPA